MIKTAGVFLCGGALIGAALLSSGCGGSAMSGDLSSEGTEVIALPNREVAALTADDVAVVMTRAGFNPEQVLELGPALRNALAGTGSARIRLGQRTEALFAIVGSNLHVSTRRRGSFIYDLKKHSCR